MQPHVQRRQHWWQQRWQRLGMTMQQEEEERPPLCPGLVWRGRGAGAPGGSVPSLPTGAFLYRTRSCKHTFQVALGPSSTLGYEPMDTWVVVVVVTVEVGCVSFSLEGGPPLTHHA